VGKNYHRKYCGGITSAVLQNGAKTAKFWLFENEPVNNFENQLRFDQDMTMSLVPPFFGRNTVYKQSRHGTEQTLTHTHTYGPRYEYGTLEYVTCSSGLHLCQITVPCA